jgi:hypothetical protein
MARINKGIVGPTGPEGPRGPEGPAGPAFSQYVFKQESAATTWKINHKLKRRPNVLVLDGSGEENVPKITYVSEEELELGFVSALSGTAYLE